MKSPDKRTWGLVQRQVTSLSASKSLSPNETGLVYVNTTSGAVTLTLPAANLCTGLGYHIRIQSGTNSLIIATTGTDTIDRAAGPLSCTADNASICLFSDGQGWFRCNIGTWT